jgi:branched-chain amino acid aminotransferase
MKVWLDGKLVDTDSASVNVYDHGLLYGDGVFEGLRAYHGRIFRLQAHIDRLFDGAKAIRLTIPQTKQEMVDALYETLKANNLSDAYIRLVVTRGIGTLGLNPFKCKRSQVIIIVDQIDLYPREMYEKGMSVIIASTVRTAPNALNPRIKSLNYLNNIMARVEAVDAGVPEAIMLNAQGLVAEATGDNVFLVRDGKLLTPPIHAGILEGITRAAVMELAGQAGVPMAEADLSRYDLYTAHECFLTGTAAEVVPVTRIDGRQIGDGAVGPLTRQIFDAFHEMVRKA